MSEPDKHEPVIDPAPPAMIWWMGFLSFLIALILFYLLITTWPVLDTSQKTFRPVNIFGWSHYWSADRQMLFTVMIAGAIGGLTHAMTSFGDYVGNRELSKNWVWFLTLRLPIGTAIALLFYCVIRGGILLPTIQSQPHLAYSSETALQINPFAMAAFGALAGMFSRQATDKLAAVFDSLFAMKSPIQRGDRLGEKEPVGLPVISSFEPPQLTNASQSLTINGSGFQAGATVTVGGKDRKPSSIEEKKIVVPLEPAEVAKPGELKLSVKNPDTRSAEASVKVV